MAHTLRIASAKRITAVMYVYRSYYYDLDCALMVYPDFYQFRYSLVLISLTLDRIRRINQELLLLLNL